MEDNFDLRILGPHRQCRLLPLARHLSRFHGHVIKLDLRQQQDHLAVVAIATGSFLVLRIHAANGHRRPFLCLARSTPPKIAPIAPHSPPWLSVTSPHQAESSGFRGARWAAEFAQSQARIDYSLRIACAEPIDSAGQ